MIRYMAYFGVWCSGVLMACFRDLLHFLQFLNLTEVISHCVSHSESLETIAMAATHSNSAIRKSVSIPILITGI